MHSNGKPREKQMYAGTVRLKDGHASLYIVMTDERMTRYEAEVWQLGELVENLQASHRAELVKLIQKRYPSPVEPVYRPSKGRRGRRSGACSTIVDPSSSTPTDLRHQIFEVLKQTAHEQTVVPLSKIAALARLDHADGGDRRVLAKMLAEISTREHQSGRPLLSAVVIEGDRKGRGLPPASFFRLARSLDLVGSQNDTVFFAHELTRVHEAWK